jgi:hypothetical protein
VNDGEAGRRAELRIVALRAISRWRSPDREAPPAGLVADVAINAGTPNGRCRAWTATPSSTPVGIECVSKGRDLRVVLLDGCDELPVRSMTACDVGLGNDDSDLDVARVMGVLDATVSVPAAEPLLVRPAVEGIAPLPR